MKYKMLLSCVCALLPVTQLHAKGVFSINISVNNQAIEKRYFDNISDMVDQYDSGALRQLAPGYTDTQALSSTMDIRGVRSELNFQENSSLLYFSIPSLGITRVYGSTNGSRAASKDEFLDALKGEDAELLNFLTKEWVKTSSIDPVAGNPNSLMSNMVVTGSDSMLSLSSFEDVHGQEGAGAVNSQEAISRAGFLPRFGRYTHGEYSSTVVTLPLMYSKWYESKGFGFAIDAPLTYTDTEGSLSGSANVGLGIKFRTLSNEHLDWYLMPQARVGLTGSEDLGSAAIIYGGGLGSQLSFPVNPRNKISVFNIFNYFVTDAVEYEDFNSGYDLSNSVWRNGIEHQYVLSENWLKKPVMSKLQYARTDYKGDELYTNVSHEFSGSIGFENSKKSAFFKEFRAGFTYTTTDKDIKGFTFNMGYVF